MIPKFVIIVIIILTLGVLIQGCKLKTHDSIEKEKINNSNIPINTEKATFAGGCFWCIEAVFDETEGVIQAISGYTGGSEEDAEYYTVSSGKTQHLEAVEITFDTVKISYEELLDLFWKTIDPTDDEGQFADKGPQYRTAIFYHDDEQKKLAEKSKKEMQKHYDKPIVTEIRPAVAFYKAEEEHQDYARKRTSQYKLYEKGSGRKDYVENKWGKS